MQETRILIIDGAEEIHAQIRSIEHRLESLLIDSAYRGEEGYEMVCVARAEGRPYSVALVDMRLPGHWNGIATIQKIREVEFETEIIICSRASDCSSHDIASELGASNKYLFLAKPFDLTEMKQMLLNLAEKFSLHQQYREAMEVLRKANAAAESSGEAKQEFLSIIGHELRTPLNVILLTLEDILEQQNDDESLQIIRNSHRSTLRLARTIEDILTYTQLDKTDFRFQKGKFSLAGVMTDVKARWALEEAALKVELSEELPDTLVGDREKLLHLINQLLSNAFKFDGKGPIALSLSPASKANSKSLLYPLKIEVRDQGIGMTSDQLQRSMELFYQANPISSGSGLGLSYVKKLVDALGGRVSLESDPGIGTLVSLHLPFLRA
jgi:two-component system NtrC family sensor kinase